MTTHRHFSLDTPPLFCEECGKDWTLVMDGRKGRRERRQRGPITLEDKFWAKVDKSDGCWWWLGGVNSYGYGAVSRTIDGRRYQLQAHRVAYELLVGPIPEGLVIDHLCRNTRCVRPDHLEPVTDKVNILRGTSLSAVYAKRTHCVQGHLLPKERSPRGDRICRECVRIKNQKARRKTAR